MNNIWGIISVLILLGVIITIHELGHFIAAKKFKLYVPTFAIGFGPQIFSKKIGDTTYRLNALPLGGYVELPTSNSLEGTEFENKKTMQTISRFKRVVVLASGAIFNLILAFCMFSGLYVFEGLDYPIPEIVITNVQEDSPASVAGLSAGDKLLEVNDISIDTIDDINNVLNEINTSKKIDLVIQSDDIISEASIVRGVVNDDELFGFSYKIPSENRDVGLVESLVLAFNQIINIFKSLLLFIIMLFTGNLSIDMIVGPVGIMKAGGEIANEVSSLSESIPIFISSLAILSANIGFFNLLPIPALDGGHILFETIEAIRRKNFNQKIKDKVSNIALTGLLIFMLVITIKDLLS